MNKLKIVLLSTSISILSICAMDISKSVIPLKTSDGAVIPLQSDLWNNFKTIANMVSGMEDIKKPIPVLVSAKDLRALIDLQKLINNLGEKVTDRDIIKRLVDNRIDVQNLLDVAKLLMASVYFDNPELESILIGVLNNGIKKKYGEILHEPRANIGIYGEDSGSELTITHGKRKFSQQEEDEAKNFFAQLNLILGLDVYNLVSTKYRSKYFRFFPVIQKK